MDQKPLKDQLGDVVRASRAQQDTANKEARDRVLDKPQAVPGTIVLDQRTLPQA